MSKTKMVLLADANTAQLRQFAEAMCLPESPPNIKDETLRAKIATVWDKDEIFIIEEDLDQPAPRDESPVTAANEDDKDTIDTIFIDFEDHVGGRDPVWASVNGRGQWIPRGQEAQVRHRYTHVLENAVRTVYDQEPDAKGNPGEMDSREVKAYPFRIIELGSKAA